MCLHVRSCDLMRRNMMSVKSDYIGLRPLVRRDEACRIRHEEFVL